MSEEKILVSACLVGRPCRYDGKSKPVPELVKLYEEGKAVLVCPECDGGLSTPRVPAERQGERVINKNGEDTTEFYNKGAQHALDLCREYGIKKAVLKSKSPSCGTDKIYDGSFTGTLTEGAGFTTELLRENGITVIDENEYRGISHE